MSSDEHWIEIERQSSDVSLVVALEDDLTKGQASGHPTVRVEDEAPATTTPSGYHVWFGLPERVVTLEVEGNGIYEDMSELLDLSERSVDDPFVCSLVPTPAYRFPAWVTLVRGRLVDADGDGIAGCSIEIDVPEPSGTNDEYAEWRDRSVRSARDGYFVYYLPNASELVPSTSQEIEFGSDTPTVLATHPDGRTESQQISIPHGSKTDLSFVFS